MKQLMVIFLFAVSAPSFAQDSNGVDAKIEQLLKLSGAEDQFTAAIDNMMAIQRQQEAFSVLPGDWWEKFSAEIHKDGWTQISPQLIEIYRNNMTEAELDHQIAYLSDPVSQEIVAKQGTIMAESMQVGAKWGQAMATRIMQELREEIEKKE